MVVISHFKFYPALFPLKWLICIPNISAVRGNVVFETLHDFYRTAILENIIGIDVFTNIDDRFEEMVESDVYFRHWGL